MTGIPVLVSLGAFAFFFLASVGVIGYLGPRATRDRVAWKVLGVTLAAAVVVVGALISGFLVIGAFLHM